MFEETKIEENLRRIKGFLGGVIIHKNEKELLWLYEETKKITKEIEKIMSEKDKKTYLERAEAIKSLAKK